MVTFFEKIEPKLQELPPNATDVEPEAFLLATRQLLPFFDMLGTPFKPVKNDIDGNITMLQKKNGSAPEKYPTFRAMLEEELTARKDKKGPAAISILWLKRALEYINTFMLQVVEDTKCGVKSENLVPFCKKAYEETLKNYHSWLIKKVFSVVSHAVPWRRDFVKTLAYGKEGLDEEVIHHMEKFCIALQSNVVVLDALLVDLELDSKEKV